MAATKFQKSFQAKRRTNEISRLTKQFQEQTSGLLGEYQTQSAGKMADYEKQSADYQNLMKNYQGKLESYRADPYTWNETPIVQVRDARAGRNVEGITLPTGQRYKLSDLESQGIAFKREGAKGFVGTLAQAPEAPNIQAPASPDVGMTEDMTARKKSLSSDYEREIAERKAGRIGSVSKRAQSRPMLSKGVTV
jgi:hypothetical protein